MANIFNLSSSTHIYIYVSLLQNHIPSIIVVSDKTSFDCQKSSYGTQLSYFASQKSSYGTQLLSCGTQLSYFASQKSSYDTQLSYFASQKSSYDTQLSSCGTQLSSFDSQKSYYGKSLCTSTGHFLVGRSFSHRQLTFQSTAHFFIDNQLHSDGLSVEINFSIVLLSSYISMWLHISSRKEIV